jgi:hypothetical protein
MKILLALVALTLPMEGQIGSMTWGPPYSYSNQKTGLNGWPNNGRYSDHDTTELCWAANGNTYLTGNDGWGPQYSLQPSGGRNMFLNTISAFTTPSAGVLETLVNSMDNMGTITQDVYSNGTSMKSGGLFCQGGAMYWAIYQQNISTSSHGSMVNLLKSLDNGATWCNPQDTDTATGTCRVTPGANGDLPSISSAMFDATTDIKLMWFVQYSQDGVTPPLAENNPVYAYGLAASSLAQHLYAYRVRLTDLPKLNGSLYQWYKGGTCSTDANWDVVGNKVGVEPSDQVGIVSGISAPLYVPNMHAYVIYAGAASGSNGFYQAPSICGPWTLLLSLPANDESWEGAILSSMTTGSGTATINFVTTFGPPDRNNGSPELSKYNPVFHVATFTAATSGSTIASPIQGSVTFH